jgi:RNA polymerase-binding transcription factor DksA
MQTILDSNNYEHWQLLAQWEDAADAFNALIAWRDANPRPDTWEQPWGSPVWDDYRAWGEAERAEEQRLGLNTDLGSDDYDKGRVQRNNRFGALVCRLRRMVRDSDDSPIIGDRIVQCPRCSTLFATFSQHDHFCTDACRDEALQNTAEAKAERRRVRQSKRSEALANRYGICLACGEQFTLKRITAKTCSEACKKRLQRKPELAEQHLQLPPIRTDLAELEAAVQAQCQQSLDAAIGAARTGQSAPPDAGDAKAERLQLKHTVWHQRCVQRLHAIADQAPALTAWLCQQSDDTVLTQR